MATALWPFVDRILGGTLEERLRAWRSEGLSAETIARKLESDHAVTVSSGMVRKWVVERDIDIQPEPTEQTA
jgi:hypothetical protein